MIRIVALPAAAVVILAAAVFGISWSIFRMDGDDGAMVLILSMLAPSVALGVFLWWPRG